MYESKAYKKLTPEQRKEGKKSALGLIKIGIGVAIFIYALSLILK